jgi:hypothetical protein
MLITEWTWFEDEDVGVGVKSSYDAFPTRYYSHHLEGVGVFSLSSIHTHTHTHTL